MTRDAATNRLAAILESIAYVHEPFTSDNGNCGASDREIEDQILKPRYEGDEQWRFRATLVLDLLGAVIPDPALIAACREAEAALAEYEAHGEPEYEGNGVYSRNGYKKWRYEAKYRAAVDNAYEALGRAVMAQLGGGR